MSVRRRLLIASGILLLILVLGVSALYAVLKLSVLPLRDGAKLGGGSVTTVVAGHIGPIAIGAYVFDLASGGVGLIDAGLEPDAAAIRAALERMGKSSDDVRAIFLTHGHNDHSGGALAFPSAAVYVMQPDVHMVERLRAPDGRRVVVIRALRDGERVEISGTVVEVFGVPGHTPGSAAFLVNGVLFLGDSAASLWDGRVQPNTLLSENAGQSVRSLGALAERLRPSRGEIREIAFGHQGAVEGLDPLLKWKDSVR
ncbi:MAG TPA: MBL fold metallo-hydrolase [Vicinamibacterales bacterium]|nr:MBL fold metallo-hydrolase [Vicinamibacterales bacterium]